MSETEQTLSIIKPDAIERNLVDEIKKKIAEVGHDSEDFKATNEAYANLHSCCKYDRQKQL